MKSYHNLDQPLPTIQEVPEAEERELEARERRLRDREADIAHFRGIARVMCRPV